MMTTTKANYQKSIDKAQRLGTARTVRQPEPNVYTVPGSQGVYTVRFDGSELVCDCRAGQRGIACYHCAAVWKVRLQPAAYPMAAVPEPDARDEALVQHTANRNPWPRGLAEWEITNRAPMVEEWV